MLRLAFALGRGNSSSCFSLIHLYMLREGLELARIVLPRLAESAAPAAFCCAADLAGMVDLLVTVTPTATRIRGARSRDLSAAVAPAKRSGEQRDERAGEAGMSRCHAASSLTSARDRFAAAHAVAIELMPIVVGADPSADHFD